MDYLDWLDILKDEIYYRILLNYCRRKASYEKGGPKRSLYIYELALRMGNYFDFCQEILLVQHSQITYSTDMSLNIEYG